MKNSILFGLFLLSGMIAQSQLWTSYQLSVNGDTINCLDKKNLKQGRWVIRTEELRGEPGYEEEGLFTDDKKDGPWRRYNLQGDILAIEFYKWGNRDGKQQYFTMLGDLLREESWKAVNPENPYDTIDVPDLNNPMVMQSKIIKHEAAEVKNGNWKFYDPTSGMVLKTEYWVYGQKEKSGGSGTTHPVTSDPTKANTKPKAVQDWEKKNSGKKKVTVQDGRTSGGG
jgi:antitoxin component YwqK of YwqJK toxin-antitoxin module